MNETLLGLFSGIAFGFVIQQVGATNPHKMARAHLMRDPSIPQFMLVSIALAILGLLGLMSAAGGAAARVNPLPLSIVATGLAGVVFGVGWGLTGYCPGTCWAAAGEGRMDALFALLGGLAGAASFAQLHETLIPLLYAPTNVGALTLADSFGNRTIAAWILALAFAAAAFAVGYFWRNEPDDEE